MKVEKLPMHGPVCHNMKLLFTELKFLLVVVELFLATGILCGLVLLCLRCAVGKVLHVLYHNLVAFHSGYEEIKCLN